MSHHALIHTNSSSHGTVMRNVRNTLTTLFLLLALALAFAGCNRQTPMELGDQLPTTPSAPVTPDKQPVALDASRAKVSTDQDQASAAPTTADPVARHANPTTAEPLPNFTEVQLGLLARPLPKRPSLAPNAYKRFTSLDVKRTGLDFGHNWSPPEGYRLEVYNSLPGGGVCIGDIDQDGWPDVFLSQPNLGNRLYRNLGGLRFVELPGRVPGTAKTMGATFIDIDNDGDLDLYVCNNGFPNQLYINDGTGNFVQSASQFGLDYRGASVMAAFADYDRDGDLDAYLVTNRAEPETPRQPKQDANGKLRVADEDREFIDIVETPEQDRVISAGQYDHLYRNNGDGTFTDVSKEANIRGNHWGLSATWWDYDRDGWTDLYVANDYYGPDHLYRNRGDGTFEDVARKSFPHTPWYSMGTDAADINNDGWLDFMGADMSGTNHYKQKASMGDMGTTGWFLVHPTPRQYMRNALYLNTGTEHFMEIAQLAGVANTDWTWSLKFADLDEDGWSDLYVTNGMNRDWTNSDIRNRSNRAATEAERIQIWLESPQRRDKNLAYRNSGKLKFQDVGDDWGLSEHFVSYGAALSDLDRDGDLDLIVNNAEEAASVYQNNTSDTHRVLFQLRGKESNPTGFGATLRLTTDDGETQTRFLNSSQGYMASNEAMVHFGLGDHDKIREVKIIWPTGKTQTLANLLADHLYLVEEEPGESWTLPSASPRFESLPVLSSIEHEEIPFNDYLRQPLSPNELSQLGPQVIVGDVNGDGQQDVLVGGAAGQATRCLINVQGEFVQKPSKSFAVDADHEDLGLLLLDADGDGDLDLYAVSGGVEFEPDDELLQDRLYLNDGQGGFQRSADALPKMLSSGEAVCAADFDRDGDMDLFVGGRVIPGQYPLTPASYLLRNDDGRFVVVTEDAAPGLTETGLVTAATWTDLDGDGWSDLLVATEWGPIKYYRNDQGSLQEQTKQAGLAAHLGWWTSVVPCDVNRDGHVDLAVGNFGWNTKYHASPEQPTLLYYGDFENTGRMRLVEAEYEDETLFPVRGKSCSTNAMPFLGQKFGTFHEFAVASLEDIYTTKCLDNSYRFAANTLTSGVFLNSGKGRFEFQAFPVLAQASPIRDLVADDFDGDGKLDLIAAQNFFGPQPETGRFDGGVGLLLKGDGQGDFSPVPARDSGISITGDMTDVALVDIDGDGVQEVIIVTNDGPMHTLRRR